MVKICVAYNKTGITTLKILVCAIRTDNKQKKSYAEKTFEKLGFKHIYVDQKNTSAELLKEILKTCTSPEHFQIAQLLPSLKQYAFSINSKKCNIQ